VSSQLENNKFPSWRALKIRIFLYLFKSMIKSGVLARSLLSPFELLHSLFEFQVSLRHMRYLYVRHWSFFIAFGYFNNRKTEENSMFKTVLPFLVF